MNPNKNKLIAISGCSGAGKSILLSELASTGYSTVPEVGRQIVKEQLGLNRPIVPWEQPKEFAELLIKKSIDAYQHARQMCDAKDNVIFFDRSFMDGISWYQESNDSDHDQYNHFMDELRFYPTVFMTPPWKEIFCQDQERKHTFEDAVNEYNRLMLFYPTYGYNIRLVPKCSVKERVTFVLSFIREIL